ncbi:hypothetical protein, partial [Candidatus Harpocratesius sp.]
MNVAKRLLYSLITLIIALVVFMPNYMSVGSTKEGNNVVNFDDGNFSNLNITNQDATDNLFVQNDEIVEIINQTFMNIYIFDSAQVTLRNVSVSGDIEVSGESTLLITQGGKMNRLFISQNAIATLDSINFIEQSVTATGNGTLILTNFINSYVSFDMNFYDTTHFQVSNSTIYANHIELYDHSSAIFDNCSNIGYIVGMYSDSYLSMN